MSASQVSKCGPRGGSCGFSRWFAWLFIDSLLFMFSRSHFARGDDLWSLTSRLVRSLLRSFCDWGVVSTLAKADCRPPRQARNVLTSASNPGSAK